MIVIKNCNVSVINEKCVKSMCSISKDKLSALCKWYRENGLIPRKKRSGGRKNNAACLEIDDVRRVVTFVTNYAEKNAVRLPGRVAHHFRSDIQLLPTSTTKSAVYQMYEESVKAAGKYKYSTCVCS